MGGEAEIRTAIVEAIVVSEVNEEAIRRRKDEMVHP